jgi:hypothetical protein
MEQKYINLYDEYTHSKDMSRRDFLDLWLNSGKKNFQASKCRTKPNEFAQKFSG